MSDNLSGPLNIRRKDICSNGGNISHCKTVISNSKKPNNGLLSRIEIPSLREFEVIERQRMLSDSTEKSKENALSYKENINQNESFRQMIEEKYNKYMKRKGSKEVNTIAKAKRKKSVPISRRRYTIKRKSESKSKTNKVELAMRLMREHAGKCPKFFKKLKAAGIL